MKRADSWVAGTLLVLLMVAALFAMLSGGRSPSEGMLPVRSSHSAAPAGTKALFLGLQEMGYDARRWAQPLDQLYEGDALLVINSYPAVPFAEHEWEALRSWLRPGRVLVLAFEDLSNAPETQGLVTGDGLAAALKPPEIPLRVIAPTLTTGLTRAARDLAIAGGHRLSAEGSADALLDLWNAPDEDTSAPRQTPPQRSAARRFLEGVIADSVALYADRGPVVSLSTPGGATVLLVATPWSLSNDGIARSGNFRLLTALLGSRLRGKVVLFDEYHHGYGHRRGFLALLSPPVRTALLHLALVLVLLVVTSAWRLGRPLRVPAPPRERTEYLSSMAMTLQRGNASRLAARVLAAHYHRWMARALKAPGTDPQLLITLASQRSPELGAQVAEALRHGEALRANQRPSRPELLHWAHHTTRLCRRLERLDHAHR